MDYERYFEIYINTINTYNDRYEVVRWLPACILCSASPLYVYIDFVKYVCNFFVDLFLCVK